MGKPATPASGSIQFLRFHWPMLSKLVPQPVSTPAFLAVALRAARSSELPTSDGRPGQPPDIPPTPACSSVAFTCLSSKRIFMVLVLLRSLIITRTRFELLN
ncbi:hypothetical protein LZ30DRAFT_716185 [Colletotrichum cereale]|nr:hypothetical protein LZ30DRAFT_716185 [Colletotrichum cereale]